MKFTLPGMLITALVAASPVALAQNSSMDYSGTSSNPATSVSKDETTGVTTQRPKQHMTSHKQRKHHTASYRQRHHAKAMNSNASTTGSGSNMAKPEKNSTTPKSK
jgi:hypothetical protein